MSVLVDLTWKATVIVAVALLASASARRWSAAERAALLRAAAMTLIALPAFVLLLPNIDLEVLAATGSQSSAVGVPSVTAGQGVAAPTNEMTRPSFVWLLYGLGGTVLLVQLFAGLVALTRWTAAATPATDPRWLAAMRASGCPRQVRLVVSRSVSAPLSWGIARPTILIDPCTAKRPERAEAVIAHEMAHIRRRDWPFLIAARTSITLFWFNPLVWLLARELGRQTELAADEEAVATVERAGYAQALLDVWTPSSRLAPACGMAGPRYLLTERIHKVLRARVARPTRRRLCTAVFLGLPLLSAPVAAMRFVPTAAAVQPLSRGFSAAANPPASGSAEAERVVAVRTTTGDGDRPDRRRTHKGDGHLRLAAGLSARPSVLGAGSRRIEPPLPGKAKKVILHAAPGQPAISEARQAAWELAERATGLRVKARELLRTAASYSMPANVRDAQVEAARNMRSEADRLDMAARRMIFDH